MDKEKRVPIRLISLFFIFLLLSLWGCSNKKKDFKKESFYRAINGKDTAFMSITRIETHFIGTYETRYTGVGTESGKIKGRISGDSLLGVYNYKSYAGNYNIAPIALLKKGNKIIRGEGSEMSYLNIRYFSPEVPIDYNHSEFVFEEINNPTEKK